MKPLLALLIALTVVFGSCTSQDEYRRKKLAYFKGRFEKIDEIKPHDLTERFLEHCEDKSSVFGRYPPSMIASQIATFYRSGAEDHAKLIVEILKYKKIKVQETSVSKMETLIKTLKLNKNDPFDYLISRSSEKMISYKLTQIEYELESDSGFRF